MHLLLSLLIFIMAQAQPTLPPMDAPGIQIPEKPTEKIDPDEVAADQAAQLFLQSLLSGKAAELASTGTDPFTFDGVRVKGVEEIESIWKRLLPNIKREMPEEDQGRLSIVDYKAAEKRFGTPPKKLAHLKLKRCKFAVVEFEKRPGFVMILADQGKGLWAVTGMTD